MSRKKVKTMETSQDTIQYEYPGHLKLTNLVKSNLKQDELSDQQTTDERRKRLYHFIPLYKCAVCGSSALFFTTRNKTLVDYKRIVMQAYSGDEAFELIGGYKVLKLKCLRCNREWYIDWSGPWPVQLLDENKIRQFGLAVL